ncbi:hypothetical protein [Jannaschia rubra]|uniref:Chaperone modulatory protein CbpM n=1 Tax=Jannaschia rubra TaxID=282197 RepID=A0A0M6XNV6_9RHOB|nr:hypothetical protein [Jannaschia rubra]CTQ31881.1 hypothetical protein JAN5088_00640 [Jannaschia rubra]SFG77947.1 chaperone modulatory protein CbpM [Jannaschia rubra]
MTRQYTAEQLIEAIPALTPDRLLSYVHLSILSPVQTDAGPAYREIDIKRVTLLCELTDDLDLDDNALVIVMSLLDQLHGTRARLDTVMRVLSDEPPEIKGRIAGRLID